MGCTEAQGYLYSQPVTADEFTQLLKQAKPKPTLVEVNASTVNTSKVNTSTAKPNALKPSAVRPNCAKKNSAISPQAAKPIAKADTVKPKELYLKGARHAQ